MKHPHHPQGPSRQKNYKECCGFIPTQNDHANKFLGNVCHQIWDTGDRTLADKLPDPDGALGLVDNIDLHWQQILRVFCVEYGLIHERANEKFLDAPGLNYGTCDRLRVSAKAALIGDAKFGRWAVEHASVNLQGHNYAVLVWELYPDVEDIWVWFGNPFLEDYTLGKFTRKDDFPRMRAALVKRLTDAAIADPVKFRFNELNCSFCSRLDCGVRNKIAAQTVDYINNHDPQNMDLEELNNIKKLTNSLKTLTKRVDDETKTRVLDDGEVLNDFVIKERVHSREVIGKKNVDTLALFIWNLFGTHEGFNELLSVSFSDIEQLIIHNVGTYRQARPIISQLVEELEAARALTTNKYYVVATKNESEK